jgi:hypothetical protein
MKYGTRSVLLCIMKTKTHRKRSRGLLLAFGILLGASLVGTSHAAVTLTQIITFDGMTNLYHYSYSIENTGTEDLILVTVPTDSSADITALSPPTGFSMTYDPSQGVVNFFEDSDLFTNQTFSPGSVITPFEFDSPFAPVAVTFTAFDVTGTEFTGSTLSPVPEPTVSLLGGLAAVAAMTRRKRNATSN